jgi:hypothetical protein
MKTLIAVLMLAVVGCGGGDSNDGENHGGDGGTGGDANELCATYHPDPRTDPGYERTDCVPEEWEGTGFCWRTSDEPDCLHEGAIAVGCILVRDSVTGSPAGTQTVGCRLAGDCVANAIDNPECCGERPDGLGAWDCPTP